MNIPGYIEQPSGLIIPTITLRGRQTEVKITKYESINYHKSVRMTILVNDKEMQIEVKKEDFNDPKCIEIIKQRIERMAK